MSSEHSTGLRLKGEDADVFVFLCSGGYISLYRVMLVLLTKDESFCED